MPSGLDGKAELRAAIQRLMAAAEKNTVHVRVQRKDLEMLLLVKLNPTVVAPPDLHPAQR